MENLLTQELIKNSAEVMKLTTELGASYQSAMEDALNVFKGRGLPSKKQEDWRYTNIAKVLAPRFYARQSEIVHDIPKEVIDQRGFIVFNNGIFNRFQSVLPDGVSFDQLRPTNDFFDAFDALNFATAMSPLFLRIKKNTVLDFPITIVHLVDEAGVNKIVSPRLTIVAESFSKVSFAEIFSSKQNNLFQYTTNASTTFELKDGAQVEHVKIQAEAFEATHVGLTRALVLKNANFKSMTIDLGIKTSRDNIEVRLLESGAESQVNGIFALKKSEHADVFSHIDHAAAHTNSTQLFKGILAGESHGAFTGKIVVAKDSQLINSEQLNKNLLLSKRAHIDTRPQLLVAADDVKCAHGATIGQLSAEEEFYLESRGIKKAKAREMLCHGFAADVLFKIDDLAIRNKAEAFLSERFLSSALVTEEA